ncbi:MAG TPA: PspC domain-containing protein [Bacteroidota bacterium]|nr:PspC domain-containing protein [Bacteroidota bacterium]
MTAEDETRRMYKSRADRMLDGVCGGVAEFFGLDSTLVRLAWVLLILVGGMGILLYIVAMIIMPANRAETSAPPVAVRERNSKFWGILLVVVGTVWFLGNLGLPLWYHWWGLAWDMVLPVLLILAGVAFLFGGRNWLSAAPAPAPPPAAPAGSGFGQMAGAPAPPAPPIRTARLFKSRSEKKLFGVCGGIAAYFSVDPTMVRLLFIIAAFASFGFMLLLYAVMAIVTPREPVAA